MFVDLGFLRYPAWSDRGLITGKTAMPYEWDQCSEQAFSKIHVQELQLHVHDMQEKKIVLGGLGAAGFE